MTRVIVNLSLPPEFTDLIKKCQKKCLEEGKKWNLSGLLTPIVIASLKKYASEFGDGNPSSNMDNFIENPEFQVTPALFRKPEDIEEFLKSIKGTPRFSEIGDQLNVWADIFNELEKI